MVEIYRFKLGSFRCIVINDGDIDNMEAVRVFSGAPEDVLLAELESHHLPQAGFFSIPVNILYVDTGEHRVLIDNGGGLHKHTPQLGLLGPALASQGIGLDEIDTMILSHGHWDHVGGSTGLDGTLAFPRARYVMARDEYRYWMMQDRADVHPITYSNLKAIQNNVDLIGPDDEIVPGIDALPAPGHTLHQSVYRVSSGGETLYCLIDTIDHPIHFKHLDWLPNWDLEPSQSIETRRRLFARAAHEKALIHGAHLAFPGLGHIVTEGDHWRYEPLGN